MLGGGQDTHVVLQECILLPSAVKLTLLLVADRPVCTLTGSWSSSLFELGFSRACTFPGALTVVRWEKHICRAGVPGFCGRLWAVFNLLWLVHLLLRPSLKMPWVSLSALVGSASVVIKLLSHKDPSFEVRAPAFQSSPGSLSFFSFHFSLRSLKCGFLNYQQDKFSPSITESHGDFHTVRLERA